MKAPIDEDHWRISPERLCPLPPDLRLKRVAFGRREMETRRTRATTTRPTREPAGPSSRTNPKIAKEITPLAAFMEWQRRIQPLRRMVRERGRDSVRADLDAAVGRLKFAAEAGLGLAQLSLAIELESGQLFSKNCAEAAEWRSRIEEGYLCPSQKPATPATHGRSLRSEGLPQKYLPRVHDLGLPQHQPPPRPHSSAPPTTTNSLERGLNGIGYGPSWISPMLRRPLAGREDEGASFGDSSSVPSMNSTVRCLPAHASERSARAEVRAAEAICSAGGRVLFPAGPYFGKPVIQQTDIWRAPTSRDISIIPRTAPRATAPPRATVEDPGPGVPPEVVDRARATTPLGRFAPEQREVMIEPRTPPTRLASPLRGF